MSACESYRNIVAFPTACVKVPLFLAIIPLHLRKRVSPIKNGRMMMASKSC